MAIKEALKVLFKKDNSQLRHAQMMNGSLPIFSQFGQNVYASDVVQTCIDIIATECSKLMPKHIREGNDGMQHVPKGNLNRLFKFAPNPLMTTRDFIEKIIWLLYLNYNAFIYPAYELVENNGIVSKVYTGFYPLNPSQVDFLQDLNGTLLVKLHFAGGDHFTLLYSDVIHLRKKFSLNEIMGGGANGQPDNAALLKVLQINDSVLQGLEKGIKTSMAVRGIMKINTLTDDDAQRAERARIEALLESGSTGILPLDLKGEFTPITIDPKIIDPVSLEFLQSKVLYWFGMSLPIFTGDYSDDQYQAFYEKTLEPIVISLGQAFSKTIFTNRELDVGNEIVFYQKDMMYLSTNMKLNLLKTAGEQGLLTDNQKLALLGYPPLEDGGRRTQSLNYVDTRMINAYQMANKNTAKGEESNEQA